MILSKPMNLWPVSWDWEELVHSGKLSPFCIPHVCSYTLCRMIPTMKGSLPHKFFFMLGWNKGWGLRLCLMLKTLQLWSHFCRGKSCDSSTETFLPIQFIHSMSPSSDPIKASCVYSLYSSYLSKCYPFFTFQLKSHILHETFLNHPSPK